MAIVSVEEVKGKRSGSIDQMWRRTYTRVWRVQTDDPATGTIAVRTAVDPNFPTDPLRRIPSPGNTYDTGVEHDYGAFAGPIEVQEETEDGKSWLVTVTYSPYDMSQFGPDPTAWLPRIQFGSQKYEKAVDKDQNGNPVTNSAGDPFADPITIDDTRDIITVTRNELVATFDLSLASQFRDKVNLNPWNGFDAKTVKCSSIVTSEPRYDSNNQVWTYEVQYVFEINRDTWKAKPLDQGFTYLSGGVRKIFQDGDGQRVDEPKLLDGSGGKLASGGTPVYLSLDVYPAVDFSAFNIDFSKCLGRV